jgi:hypothetical protein
MSDLEIRDRDFAHSLFAGCINDLAQDKARLAAQVENLQNSLSEHDVHTSEVELALEASQEEVVLALEQTVTAREEALVQRREVMRLTRELELAHAETLRLKTRFA